MVLDTHVWLDLHLFHDASVLPLARALAAGAIVVPMDARMQAELERVLAYPTFAVDGQRRAEIAARVASSARRVDTPPPTQGLPRCRDPDDQMFVEVAVAARADALLTRDAELLRLARRLRAHGIEVATPAAWCAARGAG